MVDQLYSGASCHMTNILSLMHDVENIEPIHVKLPNGFETLAIKTGTIYLNSKLRLNNVLFFPRLNCNLISIVQRIDDNICKVTFTKKLCMIRDLTTRRSIAVGGLKRWNGKNDFVSDRDENSFRGKFCL